MFRVFAILLLAVFSGAVSAAECVFDEEGLNSRPSPGQGPTVIQTRIYINDIIQINDAEQSFTGDVFFRAEWHDPRLAHGGAANCTTDLSQIWHPDLQILNRRSVQNVRQSDPLVRPDGNVVLSLRGYGDFSFRADLTEFPFDQQTLPFNIVSAYNNKEVEFQIDPELLTMSPQLSVANWQISVGSTRVENQYVPAVDRELLRLDVLLDARRLTGFYTWQQLVPLLLVVMMALVVFWIPLTYVPSRVGLAATAMLTLIAYRFAMASVLPPIAYLTRLDVFMIGASMLVFGALVTSVAITWIAENRSEEQAQSLNSIVCWLAPILLVALAGYAYFS